MLTKDKVLKGRYRITDQLGQSETGEVYEAYDSVRKTNVAVKEILIDSEKVPAISERETLKRTFGERAKILAEVKHESLPQIRGYFSEFDRQYLVMELVDGDDLSERLAKNKKPVSAIDAANWADQLLDALDYLHTLRVPIVHGDVKPQNVKLNSRGRIKLLGFDITEDAAAKADTLVTNQTSVAATVPYLPLDQILRVIDLSSQKDITSSYKEKLGRVLKQKADATSDVYALGATIYHLVTARLPIDALERTLDIWAEKPDPLPTPNALNPAVTLEFSGVLMKALEIEPEKRYQSAAEMRQALQAAVAQAKEREAEEAKKREEAAAREVLLAEEKRLEQKRQLVEQERLRLEAEQKEQKELIARQLKEAETQRLEAEKRAAEAEKRLSEEAKKAADKESVTAAKTSKNASQPVYQSKGSSKPNKQNAQRNESKNLFDEPKPDKKPSWVLPVIIVLFLVIGGAGAGIWKMRSSNAAESKLPTSNKPASVTETSAPQMPIENSAQPNIEKVSTTSAITSTVSPAAPAEKNASQSSVKNKTVAPQPTPRAEKPVVQPTKAPANKKKAVTVDDLIGGN